MIRVLSTFQFVEWRSLCTFFRHGKDEQRMPFVLKSLNVLAAIAVGCAAWFATSILFTGLPDSQPVRGIEVLSFWAPILVVIGPAIVRKINAEAMTSVLWLVALSPLLGGVGALSASMLGMALPPSSEPGTGVAYYVPPLLVLAISLGACYLLNRPAHPAKTNRAA